MKITDFRNEDALDLIADLITPASEIFADEKVRDMARANKDKLSIAQHIIRNHKSSIIEIFARMNNVPVKEYKGNAITMMRDLLDILNDSDLLAVFTSAEQKKENISFGSAMESTED